jgi:hypothetical protein
MPAFGAIKGQIVQDPPRVRGWISSSEPGASDGRRGTGLLYYVLGHRGVSDREVGGESSLL